MKSTHTQFSGPYLKGALGIAALAAARQKSTFYSARYRRLASRRRPMKAHVAVEHSMLVAIWHMLQNGLTYSDLGPDYFQRDPDRAKKRAFAQLRDLGYSVTLEPSLEAA